MDMIDLEVFQPLTLEELLRSDGQGTYQADYAAEAQRRVKAGMEYLDRIEPTWFDKFQEHFDEFDIASSQYCVIGIVFGDFSRYVRGSHTAPDQHPKLELDEAINYGFHAGTDSEYRGYLDYPLLQRAWSFEIEARLGIHYFARTEPTPQ